MHLQVGRYMDSYTLPNDFVRQNWSFGPALSEAASTKEHDLIKLRLSVNGVTYGMDWVTYHLINAYL